VFFNLYTEMAKLISNRKIGKPGSFRCSVIFLLLVANFQFVGELYRISLHSIRDNSLVNHVVYAVFRLQRFTKVPEFTYLGKHFPCVNAN